MGALFVVRYMRYDDSYPAQDYVNGATGSVRARFFALARMLAEFGRLPDGTQGHFLKPPFADIYEMKPGSGRVFGFFHERTIYLTNGADKKKPKQQKSDYEEASRLRDDFYARLVPRTEDQQ
jgi:hypothetical protein